MKLLIVTQKVDAGDPILGFFHRWIIEFAKHANTITVMCLEEGSHQLPANVRVHSLGKERATDTRRHRILYIWRFLRLAWRERTSYDCVLIHMNPEYIVIAGWLWKLLKKPIFLWYTHKSVTGWLRIAEKYVTKIFSASPESFRLETSKLLVTGHGIDTDMFAPLPVSDTRMPGSLISVGRISPTKHQLEMIKAVELLSDEEWHRRLTIVGQGVTPAEHDYAKNLRDYVNTNDLADTIVFPGSILHDDIPAYYQAADIFINLSSTGSLDKAVLEAMACGTKVLTSNEAFRSILTAKYRTTGMPEDIAAKVRLLAAERSADSGLREYVVKNHSLVPLIARIFAEMNGVL